MTPPSKSSPFAGDHHTRTERRASRPNPLDADDEAPVCVEHPLFRKRGSPDLQKLTEEKCYENNRREVSCQRKVNAPS